MKIVGSYRKSKALPLMAVLYVAMMAGIIANAYHNGTQRGLTYADILLTVGLVILVTVLCIGFILHLLVSRIELTETDLSYFNTFGSCTKRIPLDQVDTIEWTQDPDIGEQLTVKGNGVTIMCSSSISNYEELNKQIPRLAKKKIQKVKKTKKD